MVNKKYVRISVELLGGPGGGSVTREVITDTKAQTGHK
jgi:hypothetical protein